MFQIESRNNLKKALTSLPAPRNDYEIVVPEDEPQPTDNENPESATVLDQADLDLLKEQELKEASKFISCIFFASKNYLLSLLLLKPAIFHIFTSLNLSLWDTV